MRAVLVDDVDVNRDTLALLLGKYCPQVQVVGTATNSQEAKTLIEGEEPDLVFMDIEMPGESGMEFMRSLGPVDFQLIFVTAHDKYAIDAFKVDAVDYLLKPIGIEALIKAVDKAGRRKQQSTPVAPATSAGQVAISTLKGLRFIDPEEVIRCEAEGKYTTVYLQDGEKIVASKNLKEFEQAFPEDGFQRIHHGHLVNVSAIRTYRKELNSLEMNNGDSVPISHRRKDEFLRRFRTI